MHKNTIGRLMHTGTPRQWRGILYRWSFFHTWNEAKGQKKIYNDVWNVLKKTLYVALRSSIGHIMSVFVPCPLFNIYLSVCQVVFHYVAHIICLCVTLLACMSDGLICEMFSVCLKYFLRVKCFVHLFVILSVRHPVCLSNRMLYRLSFCHTGFFVFCRSTYWWKTCRKKTPGISTLSVCLYDISSLCLWHIICLCLCLMSVLCLWMTNLLIINM